MRGSSSCGASPGEGYPRFERLEFTRPASASEGEVVGTNFERKYKREGRPFYGAVLRKIETTRSISNANN